MTMQITKEGDFKATEFSELSYSGTGDGSTNYINTGIACDTINSFSIKFKFNAYSVAALYESLWGCVENSYTEYFWFRQDATNMYIYIGSPSAPIWNISSVMIEDNIYTITLTNNGSASWTVTVYNHTTGAQVYNSTQTATGTLPSSSLYIMARNLNSGTLNYPGKREVYWFEINGETWYVNNGTGTTLTGTNGTELTISGTTTNFWNDTTEWNYPTNLKMFKTTDKVASKEFIEDNTYAGLFSVTSQPYIDTGIIGEEALYWKIRFKYKNYVSGSYQGIIGMGESASARNCLLFSSANVYLACFGGTSIFSSITLTDGAIYDVEATLTSNTYVLNLYNEVGTLLETKSGSFTHTLGTINMHIGRRYGTGLASYWWDSNIYYFTINDETWYINDGTGTTVTGNKGTVLTITDIPAGFWVVSDIPNLDVQVKVFENYTKIKDEMIEV